MTFSASRIKCPKYKEIAGRLNKMMVDKCVEKSDTYTVKVESFLLDPIKSKNVLL